MRDSLPAVAALPLAALSPATIDADALVYSGDGLASAPAARKTITRMDQSGKLPRAVRIAGRKRWQRSEITAWLSAGAPPRREWEAMRK